MAGIYIYSHMAGGGYLADDDDLDSQPAYELEIPAPLPERVRLLVKEKKVSEKALALSKANEPYWVRTSLVSAATWQVTSPCGMCDSVPAHLLAVLLA